MDTMSAFLMGQANRDKPLMVFDWMKAARLISESGAQEASAGLAGDWNYTCGEILAGGVPVPKEDTYVYLASTWATPEIEINGQTQDCYLMQSETPGWDSDTYWPEEARAALSANTELTGRVPKENQNERDITARSG